MSDEGKPPRTEGPAERGPHERGPQERGRGEHRRGSLRGLARRILFDEGGLRDDEEPELDEDEQRRRLEARAVLGALLETGDKAKTETIKMVAREVRSYLEALELHKDLHHLLTNYSLEVKASIHLAPLDRERAAQGPQGDVAVRRKKDEGEG